MHVDLRYDPIPFILDRGMPMDILFLLDEAGLLLSPLAREYLLVLLSQQRRDGGFPSAFDPVHFGVLETERAVRLLLHAGLKPEALNVTAALELLLETRQPDGGWSENPALRLPPSVVHLDTIVGITWLTAEVLRALQEAGRDAEEDYWLAMDWLYGRHCSSWGWPLMDGQDQPDPDSSTTITFLLTEIYGETDPAVRRGLLYYERCLTEIARDAQQRYYEVRGERLGLDVYHLLDTVLEREAAESGYNIQDGRVARIVDAVVDIQRRDGGWRPAWMEESDPVYTVRTLCTLVWVGAMDQEYLVGMLRRHMR